MRKKYALILLAIMLTAILGTGHADGLGISSQFGYSGWPNRCTPSCAVQPVCTPDCGADCTSAPTCEAPIPTELPVLTTNVPNYSDFEDSFPTSVPTVSIEPTVVPTVTPRPTPKPTQTAAPTPVRTAAPTYSPAPVHTPSTGDDYTTYFDSAQEQIALSLLNVDREANNLAALAVDPELSLLARVKSEDMRLHHYFAHESPTYGKAADMLRTFGYSFSAVGENIAHHADVTRAEAAFMSSEGHRRNILGKSWTKVGIGVCRDENGYVYVTQLFVR